MDEQRVLVLYATETGNAFDAACRIYQEGRRRHLNVHVSSPDKYPLDELINETVVLFVVSTTGAGAEPRSLKSLWSLLTRSELPLDLFDGLHFAVFGLGDTAYEKFCWPAKKLDRRIQALGGLRLLRRGEGDDQNASGYEGVLDVWITDLFASLAILYPSMHVLDEKANGPSMPLASFTRCPNSNFNSLKPSPGRGIEVHVRQNLRITHPDWFQDVRHIEFEADVQLKYAPGDVALIYPENDDDDVDVFLSTLGWQDLADLMFEIGFETEALWRISKPVPRHTTLRTILKFYFDINAIPRRSFFENIYHFAEDEQEKEKLKEFGSIEGQDELYDYCQVMRRTILEVFQDFASIRLPYKFLFNIVPPLRPRQFSIASSSACYPQQIHLCVAIVNYRTKLRRARKGVCTSFLASLSSGASLVIEIQPGTFRLPSNKLTPVICIGPGTGIAPMRAVLEERICSGAKSNTLYFGCRSAPKDYHYRDEWLQYERENQLYYRVAFSRDDPGKRTYVQDVMKEDLRLIGRLLVSDKAFVYISGSSNQMPRVVKSVLAEAVGGTKGCSTTECNDYLRAMEESGRLFEECWS